MTTAHPTATLSAFLTARLDEDEAAAKLAQGQAGDQWRADVGMVAGNRPSETPLAYYDGELWHNEGSESLSMHPDVSAFVARHDPARVLAQVAAHRRIVELHAQDGDRDWCMEGCGMRSGWTGYPCETLKALASIYVGAEGWREEWR